MPDKVTAEEGEEGEREGEEVEECRLLGGNSFPFCFVPLLSPSAPLSLSVSLSLSLCMFVANFLLHKFMFMMCAGGKMLSLGRCQSLALICRYCAERTIKLSSACWRGVAGRVCSAMCIQLITNKLRRFHATRAGGRGQGAGDSNCSAPGNFVAQSKNFETRRQRDNVNSMWVSLSLSLPSTLPLSLSLSLCVCYWNAKVQAKSQLCEATSFIRVSVDVVSLPCGFWRNQKFCALLPAFAEQPSLILFLPHPGLITRT